MNPSVDLNADMGESFGIYDLGNDEALAEHVTTINVACGYHAADPATMRASVRLAKKHQLCLGAHIAYPDLVGFGRRRMELSEDEVRDITVHQVGALLGFCLAEGVDLVHVKPHGQLYLTGVRHRPTARGIVEGVHSVSSELKLLMYGPIVESECERAGLAMVHEGYVDLDFNADGSLVLERRKQAREPQAIADKALALYRDQGLAAVDGTWLDMRVESICIHGDGPNGPDIARAVRETLEAAGIRVESFGNSRTRYPA